MKLSTADTLLKITRGPQRINHLPRHTKRREPLEREQDQLSSLLALVDG